MTPNFDDYLNDFENSTKHITYKKHGMFYSEAFVFVSFCRHYDIDIVLESGTCLGSSTELIARSLNNVQLYTFDTGEASGRWRRTDAVGARHLAIRDLHLSVRDKLNKLDNVMASRGDGCKKLPEFINNNPNKKIAVFIDGPKGKHANRLAMKCLESEGVKFAGIHDQSLPEFGGKSYCTQSNQKYRFLDESHVGHCDCCGRRITNQTDLLDWPIPLQGFPKGPGLCIYYK